MNANHDDHSPDIDDLKDRLLARGLAEVVGGEAPPDLTERIVAGHRLAEPASAATKAASSRNGRRWAAWAVAALLLLGAVPLLLPAVQSVRESARSERTEDQVSTIATPAPSISAEGVENEGLPSPWYLTDDVQPYTPSAAPPAPSTPGFALEESAARPQEPPATSEPLGVNGRGERGVYPKFSSDLDIPFRQNSFDPALASEPLREKLEVSREGRDFGDHQERFRPWELGNIAGLRPDKDTELGTGPGLSGDQYTRIVENRFIKAVGGEAVSTFSIDVDTASYANVRQFLAQLNQLPPPDAVRIEELVNYFPYDYTGPVEDATDAADDGDETDATDQATRGPDEPANGEGGGSEDADEIDGGGDSDAGDPSDGDQAPAPAPFAAHLEVAGCPWAPEHRLVRIGIKGREMDAGKRPLSNLVFLVDVSGSMNEPSKLPLVIEGLRGLARELRENDRVAIVVYANSEGLVLPSASGSDQATILGALERLQAGGSTAGGAGIQLAYQLAEDHFIPGGTNRVILCTDGDFNVGVTSTAELERMVEQKAKETGVFLSVLGFGRGNLNDTMMEAISNRGNGNYAYIDSGREARRVLVEQITGTLVTIAKDVKIQVEFNPRQVAGYRLIGYENRLLRTEDFNDDTKDAGEIGAGHTVTALYEVVPAGQEVDVPPADELKYQQPAAGRPHVGDNQSATSPAAADGGEPQPHPLEGEPAGSGDDSDISHELLTLKMRYKQPEGTSSRKLEWAVTDAGQAFGEASVDFQFAAAVAGFGMMLRDSEYKGNLTYDALLEIAAGGGVSNEHDGEDEYRTEFLDLVRRAKELSAAVGRE